MNDYDWAALDSLEDKCLPHDWDFCPDSTDEREGYEDGE